MESEKINIFGSDHNQIGSSDQNLILKTAGKIKIQIGRKFIDLIDNKGNINIGRFDVIQKVNSIDDINGTGIFYVGESIIVSIDGQKITLTTDSGTNYVSFVEKQDVTRDQQITAQENIGFLYDSLDDIKNINSGIVYIESEKSLYIVNEGNLEKYSIEIPNPYPKQFVISKNDDKKGSLLITGEGIENSVAFNNLFIYNEKTSSNFKSNYPIIFTVNDKSILEVQDNKLITDNIQSRNANQNFGYRLYLKDGESTLEIDNLVIRNWNPLMSTDIDVIPLEYYKDENIIQNFKTDTEEDYTYYTIELKYDSTYEVDDILSSYILTETLQEEESQEESQEEGVIIYKLEQVQFKVTEVLSPRFIKAEQITELNIKDSSCINKVIGLVDEDLVIGKIGQQYNSKEHGIISKQNIFYSAKFDKDEQEEQSEEEQSEQEEPQEESQEEEIGEEKLIYPYYSQKLQDELSPNIEDSSYNHVIPPLGLIKNLQLVHYAEYIRDDRKIYFRDYNGNDLFYIDATDFIKDGMVSNVAVEYRTIEGEEIECLVVTFNEDSGQEEIPIPLYKIFDSRQYYTKAEIDGMMERVPSAQDLMPLGSIIMWAYPNIPNGWLPCNGGYVYGEMYQDFINLYGNAIPDLRGRFVVGKDTTTDFDNLGKTGGERQHTLTTNELPSHSHNFKDYYFSENKNELDLYGITNYDKVFQNSDKGGARGVDTDNDSLIYYEHATDTTGNGDPHNILPPYYTLYYIIKVF